MQCHIALGWPRPVQILDLYVEFRALHNGLVNFDRNLGLLAVMAHYGLPCIDAVVKKNFHTLILRGGYSNEERAAILDYCETDVEALGKLLPVMAGTLTFHAPYFADGICGQ